MHARTHARTHAWVGETPTRLARRYQWVRTDWTERHFPPAAAAATAAAGWLAGWLAGTDNYNLSFYP